MNPQKQLTRMARRLEQVSLPDRCEIETVSGTPTMTEDGILVPGSTLRTYKGSTSTPCRLDNSRSFRPETLPNQEINANEYVLHFPLGVEIKPNDKVRVVVGDRTHTFEVRKLSALSQWRVMNEALIVELEGQHD